MSLAASLDAPVRVVVERDDVTTDVLFILRLLVDVPALRVIDTKYYPNTASRASTRAHRRTRRMEDRGRGDGRAVGGIDRPLVIARTRVMSTLPLRGSL